MIILVKFETNLEMYIHTYKLQAAYFIHLFAEIVEIVKRSIIRYITIERQFLKQINVVENL